MTRACWIATLLAITYPTSMLAQSREAKDADLSPANWEQGEIDKYLALEVNLGEAKPLAEGSSGLIAGSSSTLAMRAGLGGAKQGGRRPTPC